MVENQEKLSTRFSDIVDLLIESDYWAGKEKAELVSAKHVEQAIVEKTFRLNLIEKAFPGADRRRNNSGRCRGVGFGTNQWLGGLPNR